MGARERGVLLIVADRRAKNYLLGKLVYLAPEG